MTTPTAEADPCDAQVTHVATTGLLAGLPSAALENVDPEMLAQITAHALPALNILRLSDSSPDTSSTTLNEYPTVESLLSPLSLYLEIVRRHLVTTTTQAASEEFERGARRHLAHLRDLAKRYDWSTVVQYHMEFHRRRCVEMLAGQYGGWGTPDPDLMKNLYDLYESTLGSGEIGH